jgi:sugar O-acyltransferase (sialic acid O-acetyltransferase NeuD family)
MTPVVLFGTGQFAHVADAYLARSRGYDVVGFTVHERHRDGEQLLGRPVVAFEQLEERFAPGAVSMLVAVGYSRLNAGRTAVYQECRARGYSLISYVDDRALCTGDIAIGDNCFVFEANVIQPFVRVGNNVVMWSGNHVGHHASIGDNCFIASHAVISGGVTIGENCFVGVNATIGDGVRVARDCIIGAGVTILRDTKESEVYRASSVPPQPYPSRRWRI